MRIASSLTNRVFLACTLLATLSLGFALYFVDERASAAADAGLQRGFAEAVSLVDEHSATRTDHFTRLARVVADLPKLKAAVETGDPPTVQPLADEYRAELNADLLLLTGEDGRVLGLAGAAAGAADVPASLAGLPPTEETSLFRPHARGVLQLGSVPIFLEGTVPDILGRLTVGVILDDRQAEDLKRLSGSEIAFGAGGRVLSSTLPPAARAALGPVMAAAATTTVTVGGEEYLALARPLAPAEGLASGAPVALILRSRTERLQFLDTIRTALVGVLLVALLLATVFSYAVARTMTRPLAAITDAMRDVAATGDLTRKVTLKSRAWDDEDARTLAAAFNTLTESIARFQREAAQKERLSSLGRLSTVIAHEVRNPLMIIRASLATLRRDRVSPSELREAVADIDEETQRLNRIVSEVLDFARPIRFELAEADLNQICRASIAAAWAGDAGAGVRVDLDPAIPPLVTDAERLRTALVNMLTNARHAVAAATPTPVGAGRGAPAAVIDEPSVHLSTRAQNGRVTIAIRDRGVGITSEEMPHIFDPFFTTRRAGTGLGLPIAKNIVEGLGGTLQVSSRPGDGTEVRIDLPRAAAHPGA